MPTFAWVALGMLTAGIGGAAAVWASMALMYLGVEPQPPEVLRNLAALGGVAAAMCGGLASLGRGTNRNRADLLTGLAVLVLGGVAAGIVNPGFLFSPFLLIVAPLQGLAALLGGFVALAALWAVLWVAGIRDAGHVPQPPPLP